MRNLMLSTAMVLPFMMAPAMAQDTATPAPADPATSTTEAPMGADATPAADAEMDTEVVTDDAEQAASEAELAASGKVAQQQDENELRIDWITDATVNAPDGTAIGDINDVIVDAQAGTMKAAIIGVGGFLGIGEKQIAVPWDQLTINHDAQQISSDLTKEEAEAAPEYVFRDQEDVPADATAVSSPTDMTATTPANVEGTEGEAAPMTTTTTTTTPDSAAATTSDPAMTSDPAAMPDPAASGSATGMDPATTTTTTDPAASGGAAAPADTAETPATEPMETEMETETDMEMETDMESETTPPAEGTTTAPAN